MSMRIQTILVPTDFSRNAHVAVEKGCESARQLGAKLYPLHAQDQSTLRTAIREELFDGDATDEQLQARVMKMVEAADEMPRARNDYTLKRAAHSARLLFICMRAGFVPVLMSIPEDRSPGTTVREFCRSPPRSHDLQFDLI